MKAYSVYSDFSDKARGFLMQNGIQIDLNNTGRRPDKKELANLVREYDILIIGVQEILSPDIYLCVKNLKIVCTMSRSTAHIDKCFSNKVKIINLESSCENAEVAQFALALTLTLHYQLHNECAVTRKPTERNFGIASFEKKTIGVLGAGNIGGEFIKQISAFNKNLLCFTAHPSAHSYLQKYGVKFVKLPQLIENSDIICCCLPLNDGTCGLVGKDLSLIKENAIIVSTSPLHIFDVDEFIKVIELKHLSVALDINNNESKHIKPLLKQNCIVTKHRAALSCNNNDIYDMEIAKKLVKYVSTT